MSAADHEIARVLVEGMRKVSINAPEGGEKEKDTPASRFMSGYKELVPHVNVIDPRQRVAAFKGKEGQKDPYFFSELRTRDDNTVHISWLNTDPAASGKTRGTGLGSYMLKKLTGLADTHGVKLTLAAARAPGMSKSIGLSVPQLKKWYGRHGFVEGRGGAGWMERDPQKVG